MRAWSTAALGLLGVILEECFRWAFDHFLWDWLIQFFETTWHFKEAELIASISSYVVPIVGAALCIIAIYWLLRHEMAKGQIPLATHPLGANRYMTAHEALHYLADESAWGKSTSHYADRRRYAVTDKLVTTKKVPLLEAPEEFKRVAEQGAIKAVGILNGQAVQIPETYWALATLDPTNRDGGTMATTRHPVPIYEKVIISQEDIERAWPRSWSLWPFSRKRRHSR